MNATATTSDQSQQTNTWTFVGHWENDEIVVEYIVPGEYQDPRVETGYWPEGLFCASAEGRNEEQALAAVRAEYETCDDPN